MSVENTLFRKKLARVIRDDCANQASESELSRDVNGGEPRLPTEPTFVPRTHATIWTALNDNLDCASCCTPLVHVMQHSLREKRRQNRTGFRLCSPLLDSKE